MTERQHWSSCAVNNAPAFPAGPCDCGGYAPTPSAADVELVEVEPGKWRVRRDKLSAPRSDLPLPYVISDSMPPLEQVDGKFYTSKRAFRAVGRAHGLTEVGTEKMKPKTTRTSSEPAQKQDRRNALRKAIEKVRGV